MAVIVTSADMRDLADIFNKPECQLAAMEVKFMTSFMEKGRLLNVFALRVCAMLTMEEFTEKLAEKGFICEVQ